MNPDINLYLVFGRFRIGSDVRFTGAVCATFFGEGLACPIGLLAP